MATDYFDFSKNSSSMEDPVASLIAVGQKALATGAVTPKQAAKNAKKINPVLKAAGITTDPLDLIRKRNAAAVAAIANTPDGQALGTTNVQNPMTGTWTSVPNSSFPSVPQVAKGSGLSNSLKNYEVATDTTGEEALAKDLSRAETGMETGNKNTVASNLYMTPEELQQLTSGVEGTDFIGRQRAGIENMQDLLAMEAERPTDSLTGPLAGILQMEFGRNPQAFLQGRGPSPQDQGAKILAYQGKIQDDKRDLAAKVLETVGKMKSGTATENAFQILRDKQLQEMIDQFKATTGTKDTKGTEAKAEAEDPLRAPRNPPATTAKTKLFDSYTKYIKDDQDALKEAQNAKQTLLSGTKVGQEAFKNFLARASGEKGPLTNQDISRFSGDPSVVSRLERVFTKATEGTLTDADQADMKLLINSYVDYRRKVLDSKTKYYRDQVAPSVYGVSSEDFDKGYAPAGGFGLPDASLGPKKKQSSSTPTYDGSKPLPANATEEMKNARRDYLKKKAGS